MLFNNIINYLKKSILIIYYFSFFCKKIKKFHLIHMKVILEFYDYEKNKLKRNYIKEYMLFLLEKELINLNF